MASRCSALVLALAAGCAAVPPSRTELTAVSHGGGSGWRVAAGGHSASAPARVDLPFDLGAGYVYEVVGDGGGQHGSYVELAGLLWRRGRARAFLGGRGEIFWNEAGPGSTSRAASARLSIERVAGHVAGGLSDRKTAIGAYGLFAGGVFLEAGVRDLWRDGAATSVLAGLYVRLPMVAAISSP
jgi:hypothetical protein